MPAPSLPRRTTPKRPTATRCLIAALVMGTVLSARAEPNAISLDAPTVARLAEERSPGAMLAKARIGEARALHVGASTPASANPEINAYAGPRWFTGKTGLDAYVALSWPFDLSGAPRARVRLADERTALAETEARGANRAAVAEALDLWARARGADLHVALQADRLALDEAMLHAAEARRRAGTVGDGDVALARTLRAQGVARKATAEAERTAIVARLRPRIGLSARALVALAGSLEPPPPPPLAALVARLPEQPLLARADAAVRVAQQDETLQRAIIVQPPRVSAGAGQESETFAHFGLDIPLAVYQRNQTNEAVAEARARNATIERAGARALAEAELYAAYATYEGARDAYRALEAVTAELADTEHLALRSYELGQTTLMELVTVRRETSQGRAARIDALVLLARAKIGLDAVVGTSP
jgi:outer membrane protein TolC